jgi:hypothetical protein
VESRRFSICANPDSRQLARLAGFGLCRGGYQANCVIDGDTIEYMGRRVRMVDYDAPEIGEPKCTYELEVGHHAKNRLLEILNSGSVKVSPLVRVMLDALRARAKRGLRAFIAGKERVDLRAATAWQEMHTPHLLSWHIQNRPFYVINPRCLPDHLLGRICFQLARLLTNTPFDANKKCAPLSFRGRRTASRFAH